MLKPVEPTQAPERPIGELVHELVEEGKAYARAEVGLAKIVAVAKAKALALPIALFAVALLIMLAALNAFAVGLVLALAKFIGPLAAGFAGMLILAAIAGGLIWFGIERARQAL
jgi:uncharacterized integral membrane protein